METQQAKRRNKMLTVQDEMIEQIMANYIMAGIVEPDTVAGTIEKLHSYSLSLLNVCLIQSREALKLKCAKLVQAWRN